MKKFLIVLLFLSGCSLFMSPAEREYLENKVELERSVELLRLQLRKAQLENKLMELDKDL